MSYLCADDAPEIARDRRGRCGQSWRATGMLCREQPTERQTGAIARADICWHAVPDRCMDQLLLDHCDRAFPCSSSPAPRPFCRLTVAVVTRHVLCTYVRTVSVDLILTGMLLTNRKLVQRPVIGCRTRNFIARGFIAHPVHSIAGILLAQTNSASFPSGTENKSNSPDYGVNAQCCWGDYMFAWLHCGSNLNCPF